MSTTESCPNCGSPLVFRVATTTTAVCEYCSAIVVRGGAQLEMVGKTNEILATGSLLKLGLTGKVDGKDFTIVGRTQLSHELGGTWDEWLLVLENEKLAWLAEHQGRYSLLAEAPLGEAPQLRSPDDTAPGKRYFTGFGELVVVERGTATVVGEEGELPDATVIGSKRPFVDFAASKSRVATLDFGMDLSGGQKGQRRFFIGVETSPAALGLKTAEVSAPVMDAGGPAAVSLSCPQCGAPLEKKLKESESLVCSSCSSALSVEENGELGFLFAQERLPYRPWIPVGTKAHLDAEFLRHTRRLPQKSRPWPSSLDIEVVACVVRTVNVDGVDYPFQEFLLHTEREGFFWLVESDAEWMFVRNLNPGLVLDGDFEVLLDGRQYGLKARSTPRVAQVTGELYFKVQAGETSQMADFKAGVHSLSKEKTRNELIWTEAVDVDREDVARVFGITPPSPPVYDDHGSLHLQSANNPGGCVVLVFVLLFFGLPLMFATVGGGGGGGSGYHYGK